MRLRDKGDKVAGREKHHTASSEVLQCPLSPFLFLACVFVHFSKSNGGSDASFFSPKHVSFSLYILHLAQSLPTTLPTSCSCFNSAPSVLSQNFKSSYSDHLNHSESCYPSARFVFFFVCFFNLFILFPLIPGSQRVLFRRGVMGMQGGRQQCWDRGLRGGRRGMRRRLMLMVVVVVMVDRRAIVGDDGRGGGEDVGGRGRRR